MTATNCFTIDSVLGQEKAKKMLRRAVRGKRLSHAYLFRGPAGVGKKTLARAFGNYLNCQSPTDSQDACGSCQSCHKLKSGNHPDLLLVEPDGVSIKIKQIRDLKRALTFAPFEANYRIVMISDVHTMAQAAGNSLLKILEEPPPGNLLILTGDAASQILATIISRCQIIPFTDLPHKLVTAELVRSGIAPEFATSLAAITYGSLGQAQTMSDLGLLETTRTIIEELVKMKQSRTTSIETVFKMAEQAANLDEHLPQLLELLKLWFRDLILLTSNLAPEFIGPDMPGSTRENSRIWTRSGLLAGLELLDKSRRQLSRNCNKTLVCENLFFGLL